jgi:ATP-dependent protease ClpP protease subunit
MRKINTDLPYYVGTYSITALIDEVSAVEEDAEISWDSTGGSVWAGQKFIDYLNNRESKLTAKVTGIAASMGAAILPFFDHVIGAEQSEVMIHAARGGPDSTLKSTNQFLYEALAKKIDEDIFKEVTGHKLKTIMLGEERIDVWLTGKQAKKVKLYDETFNLLKGKAASLFNNMDLKELDYEIPEGLKEKYGLKKAKNVKSKISEMEIKDVTAGMLENGNKEAYDAIFNAGKQAYKSKVARVMKYAKYDIPKATEILEKDAEFGEAELEHFIEKKHDAKKVAEIEDSSDDPVIPGTPAAKVETKETPDEKADKEAWAKELDSVQMVTGSVVETSKN